MRSPENFVARELLPEFPTWAEMRQALDTARHALDAAGVYFSLYGRQPAFALESFV